MINIVMLTFTKYFGSIICKLRKLQNKHHMLTQRFIIIFISLCVIFTTVFILLPKEKEQEGVVSKNRLDEKYEPSEEFFLQRAYPDGKIDFKTYKKALESAREQVALRSGTTGINTPWKIQGPGNIGARVNTVTVDPNNEAVMYAGFARGGVWKTTDSGATWNPIFDDQLFLSIGDIVVDPSDSNTVYVGTGDPNISGYPSIGDGIYKSIDGGLTWENLGLEEQRIISKIIIDPTNSNTIYVGTMGLPFERNEQRGLYKSTDGGQSWEQILFLDDGAGIIDMVMQVDDPQTLYVAGWNRIRNNFESEITGDDAKIYKTTDAGTTWITLEGGLPQRKIGRIGLTISKTNPETVFAMYVDTTSQLNHIYKTTNGGILWDTLNTTEAAGLNPNALGGFGWYFGKVRVNPKNDDDLYLLGVDLWRSLDGGQSWFMATPPWWEYSVHADKHDLLFTNSDSIILATDGGLYKTDIFNDEWRDIESIPTTQFYRVAYNPHQPDWYYGGAQDNGTTGGNAENINEWPRIFGGDGFQAIFNPDDPNIVYTETQRGRIYYSDDGGFDFNLAIDGIDDEDTRNWDMPIIMSTHSSNLLYTGTDRLYYSDNPGFPFWNPVTDNLTDQDTSELASRNQNISAIDESKFEPFLVYVGTGDGNLWKIKADNNEALNTTNDLPNQYITSVYTSPNIEDNVYVSYSGYRDNDNTPKIYRSTNKGDTWESIEGNLPNLAINDIWIYPNYQDSVIIIGTDGGVYLTENAGVSWDRLGSDMPIVPVYDVDWNEANNEVIAGTFARSIMTFPLDSMDIVNETPVSTAPPITAVKVERLKLYPNPASDYINVQYANNEAGKTAEIVLLDAQGRLLQQFQNDAQGKTEQRLNIQDLPNGTYFVKVKVRHSIWSGTFVK